MLTGSVLLLGGSGFLCRGILRRARREGWAWRPTVYSRDEYKQDLCRQRYPEARYLLGDVRDRDRLEAAMAGHDTVIHAAAIKYVVDAEFNAVECVNVNVLGSLTVAEAAIRSGVPRVVGISTDKCVQPINAYGASKMVMERLFGEMSRGSTTFTLVRYGNVVGSTGSVIPLFQRQLRESGTVRVTDPAMTRFWMSVDDAVDCILFAAEPCRVPGGITVPRPRAMRLCDLAFTIAGGNVTVSGARPGEKQHEELMHEQESVRALLLRSYYELSPVSGPVVSHPFHLSSASPEAGWVTPDEMRAMIADAEGV